jgi:ABC-type branched-subunit amino acid transport system substrate-binding protein
MLLRRHPGEWGPVEWATAVVAAAAVAVLGVFVVRGLLPGDCGEDLDEVGGECVGVTDESFPVQDADIRGLLKDVAEENRDVRTAYESDGTPYVRIALMMPFTADDTSAMTSHMIRRGLAGALAAQQKANSGSAPHYQLLLAPDGKDLDKWDSVTPMLSEMAQETEAPLVGVTGLPSSTPETRAAIDDLSEREIPTIGPILTAADMNSPYLFKTSPNNEQFAGALAGYLQHSPGGSEKKTERGFLVWDQRKEDVYSKNLREVFDARFGTAYGLDDSNAPYTGVTGKDQGTPQRFTRAVEKICGGSYDTVFFAGRDQDLPAFIKRLADRGGCDDRSLRILKVGIGLEPTLTTDESTRLLKAANATIVDASSVDPEWLRGEHTPPEGSHTFLRFFNALDETHDLGPKPLDDGYAAMYYDSFVLLADAVDYSFTELNESGDHTPDPAQLPRKAEVYDTLIDSTIDEGRCSGCLVGASGTYGFESQGKNDQWAVCKPVPIVEYPPRATDSGKPSTVPVYRTYRDTDKNACPD